MLKKFIRWKTLLQVVCNNMDNSCNRNIDEQPSAKGQESSCSQKSPDNQISIASKRKLSNKPIMSYEPIAGNDSNESDFRMPSRKNDVKVVDDSYSRTRRATLPSTNTRKEKKHRGLASCLFRGQDHSQRLLDEFDTLRNLQGKNFLLFFGSRL